MHWHASAQKARTSLAAALPHSLKPTHLLALTSPCSHVRVCCYRTAEAVQEARAARRQRLLEHVKYLESRDAGGSEATAEAGRRRERAKGEGSISMVPKYSSSASSSALIETPPPQAQAPTQARQGGSINFDDGGKIRAAFQLQEETSPFSLGCGHISYPHNEGEGAGVGAGGGTREADLYALSGAGSGLYDSTPSRASTDEFL